MLLTSGKKKKKNLFSSYSWKKMTGQYPSTWLFKKTLKNPSALQSTTVVPGHFMSLHIGYLYLCAFSL